MLFRIRIMLSSHYLLLGLLPVTKLSEMLLSPTLVSKDWGKHSSFTWPNHKESRFWISIHLWYSLDEVVEIIDDSLDVFFEHSGVLPFIEAIIMFSSMLRVGHRFECIELLVVEEKCIFTKSLTGAIMHNGNTRERSNVFYNT